MDPKRDPLIQYLRRPGRRRLARVVEAYHGLVWKIACRLTGNEDDAADLAQDIFLELLTEPPAAERVRSPAAFLAWRVMARASRLRRAAERRRRREKESLERRLEPGLGAEEIEAVREAIDGLPEELRLPVELHYLAGLPNREIAALLELPLRTLEHRLARARRRLKERLEPLASVLLIPGRAEAAPPPPASLLPRLQRAVRRGPPLAAAATFAAPWGLPGALLMSVPTKAAIAAATAAAAILAGATFLPHLAPLPERRNEAAVASDIGAAGEPPGASARPAGAGPELPDDASREREGERLEGEAAGPPRARLRGIVRYPEGEPIAGAEVIFSKTLSEEEAEALRAAGYADVEPGKLELTTTSGEDGAYSFAGLLPGRGRVAARHGGRPSGAPRVELEPGREGWREVVFRRLLRIHGSIRDRSGRALPGSAVLVRLANLEKVEQQHGMNHALFPAGGLGRFDTGARLGMAPSFSGVLIAWAEGHALSWRGFNTMEFRDWEAEVDFELEPELEVLLRVLDPLGRPVAGAEIGRGDETSIIGDVPYPLCHTGADGASRVPHLPAKLQMLRVAREGYHTATVEVGPEPAGEIQVTLEPLGAAIEAQVVFDDAIPPGDRKHVSVWLSREVEPGKLESVQCRQREDHGKLLFTFWPRRSGRYVLGWRHGGDRRETGVFEHSTARPLRIELSIAPPPLEHPYIRGEVVRAGTGEAAGGVEVLAYYHPRGQKPSWWAEATVVESLYFPGIPRPWERTVTDDGGRFLLRFPAGEAPMTAVLRAGDARRGWSEDVAVELEAATSIDDFRLELLESGAVEGKVTGATGEGVPGELIALYDGRGLLEWKPTDGEGRFRLEGLRPGRYAVEALGRGRGGAGHSSGSPGEEPSPAVEEVFELRLEVRGGETAAVLFDLERERLGRIEGRFGGGLPPVAAVEAFLLEAGGRRLGAAQGLRRYEETHGGRFAFANLHSGTYLLQASRKGIVAEARVEVRRGEVASVPLSPPAAALFLPLPALGPEVLERLEVAAAQRRLEPAPPAFRGPVLSVFDAAYAEERSWEEWGGFEVQKSAAGLTARGLPAGVVRLKVTAPGLPDAWSEPCRLTEGRLETAAPLVFPEGRSLRVRLARADREPLPEEVRFSSWGLRGAVSTSAEKSAEEATWILRALAPGPYRISAEAGARLQGHVEMEVPPGRDPEELEIELR